MPRPRIIDDATLLDAAREVFAAKGISATTRDIAKRAGVSEGVLFQRYKTKADLFFAAMAPPASDPTAILALSDDAVGNREAFEEAALKILAYFREAMPLLLPLVSHPSFDSERFFGNEAPASLQLWIDALTRFLASGQPPRTDEATVRGAATLLTSSMFGVALIDTIGIHGPPMPDVAIRSMVRAMWDGIGTDTAAPGGS